MTSPPLFILFYLFFLCLTPSSQNDISTQIDLEDFPSYYERTSIVFTNLCRMAPKLFKERYLYDKLPITSLNILNSFQPQLPLSFDYDLNRMARAHSQDMLEHSCFPSDSSDCNGTSVGERVQRFFKKKFLLIENIMKIETSNWDPSLNWPLYSVATWACGGSLRLNYRTSKLIDCPQDSLPSTRHSLLDSKFKKIGMGISMNKEKTVFLATQDLSDEPIKNETSDILFSGSHFFLENNKSKFSIFFTFWSPRYQTLLTVCKIYLEGKKLLVYFDYTNMGLIGRSELILISNHSHCRQYYFSCKENDTSKSLRFPSKGYYLTFGEGSCTKNWIRTKDPITLPILPNITNPTKNLPEEESNLSYSVTDCSIPHKRSGCNNMCIEMCVCERDSSCCYAQWDIECITEMQYFDCETKCKDVFSPSSSINSELQFSAIPFCEWFILFEECTNLFFSLKSNSSFPSPTNSNNTKYDYFLIEIILILGAIGILSLVHFSKQNPIPKPVILVKNQNELETVFEVNQSHSIIHLEEGVYEVCNLITKPIDIIGIGRSTIIQHKKTEVNPFIEDKRSQIILSLIPHTFVIYSSCLLENLALNNTDGHVIWMKNGKEVKIKNCDISSTSPDLPLVVVEKGTLFLENCKIHDCLGAGGIVIQGNGKCILNNCQILNNYASGIEVREYGNAQIMNCLIGENERGIFIWQSGQVFLHQTKIQNNKEEAVLLLDKGKIECEGADSKDSIQSSLTNKTNKSRKNKINTSKALWCGNKFNTIRTKIP